VPCWSCGSPRATGAPSEARVNEGSAEATRTEDNASGAMNQAMGGPLNPRLSRRTGEPQTRDCGSTERPRDGTGLGDSRPHRLLQENPVELTVVAAEGLG
jgi:hypothetical protein